MQADARLQHASTAQACCARDAPAPLTVCGIAASLLAKLTLAGKGGWRGSLVMHCIRYVCYATTEEQEKELEMIDNIAPACDQARLAVRKVQQQVDNLSLPRQRQEA